MSVASPDSRPSSGASPPTVFQRFRRWKDTFIALYARSPAEREAFVDLPAWLRGALLSTCLVYGYALARLAPRDVPSVAAVTILYALTMLIPPVPSPLGYLRTPRVAFLVTLMLLWSPLHTLIAVAVGTLLGVVALRLYEPWRALLNSILWAYPAALASMLGHATLRFFPDPLVGLIVSSFVILVVYLGTNFGALALYRHLRLGDPFFAYWWSCMVENPLAQLLSVPLPVFLGAVAIGTGFRGWLVLLLTGLSAVTMPLARTQLTLYAVSQRTVEDIVRALMLALDRTVPGAQAHAERVSELVAATAHRLKVGVNTIDVWRTAALLHDIGLIDAQSRTTAPAAHAQVGAKILTSYPDPAVADIVREHHAPWTAVRLHGHAALGARVLAAAECYDELRYGAPGRPALVTHAATAAAMRRLAGSSLDPDVVSALLAAADRREPAAVS